MILIVMRHKKTEIQLIFTSMKIRTQYTVEIFKKKMSNNGSTYSIFK